MGKVAAGDIQAGHEQVAAGGGLGQVDDLPHIARMHVGPDEQQAGLGEAAAALVHGRRTPYPPRRHGRHRQAVAKVEVGAVGFVGKAEHPGVVGHLDNGAQVGADAVVGGVVHQHGHRVGVLLDGLFHLLPLHAQRDAQALVHLRVHIHRHRAAEHQRVQHAAVHVAGQDDLIAPLAGGEHHALHTAGGGQLLCFPDDRYRVAEVIQRLHAVHVHAHALLAQKGGQLRVAAAPLVAGHIKGHHTHLPEPLQRFVNGRAALVQPEPCTVLTHVFPPSLVPDANKKAQVPHQKVQTCAWKKAIFCATKPPDKMCRSHGPRFSMIQKDGMMRVYIAILLLLLFIDRFTSLRTGCAISWL